MASEEEFVHLHVHSDYSLLDGAASVSDIVKRSSEFGLPAVACTDHGNMSAAVEFYQVAKKYDIKPIIGCEFYVAPRSMTEKDSRDPHAQGFHLVLLAQNEEGYYNLCMLNSKAHLEGFYYKPRVDKQCLAKYSNGLIALSACIAGEVQTQILNGKDKEALASLEEYQNIFGRDNFYLEIQDHGLEEEKQVKNRFLEWNESYGIPVVATSDAHYLQKDHARAHDVLLAIGTQATLDTPNRMKFPGDEFYLKSPDEMRSCFSDCPEALENTLAIAERCNLELKVGDDAVNHYPFYSVPEGKNPEQVLRDLCYEGIPKRYGFDPFSSGLTEDQQAKLDRLEQELDIIQQTGFTSYFLIVWDFIRYAREQDIPVGPGRGSGAGSIVAYLMYITDIDPIRYNLLFERFLNPDRVSPPDFDIDLCERRRQEVIEYVRDKYGEANVAQIGTFGTLKAKAVIKDVGRVMGCSFRDVNDLTKKLSGDPNASLNDLLENNEELRKRQEQEEWVSELIKHAEVLEGLNRNMSIHAAGVIIGDQPLAQLIPLARGSGGNEVITQYSAGPCEDLGLLKMDFLGLRTLTLIRDALDLIAESRGTHMREEDIPDDDPAAYRLLNEGATVGVFQLESGGMQDLCRRFGVHRLEDIIALIALYRPGPMQFLDDFISRKMGETPIEYDVPEMKPILEETYGIMLYQEQVMQVVQRVAGFSLGQADILRRAMGKKKVKVMEAQYGKFIEGCKENGYAEETAKQIWDKIAMFASYGFNKSHSASYAVLAYRTAYLKANYPVEFMAALLSSELNNFDKLAFFLKECRYMGIQVKQPDVSSSGLRFSVDGDCIRFGLAAIKGVGSSVAEKILKARAREGPFQSLVDFCERVGEGVNRKAVESLCRAGAFDSFGLRRSQVYNMIEPAMSYAQRAIQDKAKGQASLFEAAGNKDTELSSDFVKIPETPEWDESQRLADEKELLGFYVTGHPVSQHREIIETYQIDRLENIPNLPDGTAVRTGGIIAGVSLKKSKKDQRPWAILNIENLETGVEALVFPDTYETLQSQIEPEKTVLVEATISRKEEDSCKLFINRIVPIEEVPETYAAQLHVRIYERDADDIKLQRLREICDEHPGNTQLVICVVCESGRIGFLRVEDFAVCNTATLREAVRDLFGRNSVVQKADLRRPETRNGRSVESRQAASSA